MVGSKTYYHGGNIRLHIVKHPDLHIKAWTIRVNNIFLRFAGLHFFQNRRSGELFKYTEEKISAAS